MSGRSLFISALSRKPIHGPGDTIRFKAGVNVIVGRPNTGKSKWLRMVDYLFGDNGKPQDVFGDDLFAKYESVKMEIVIGNEEFIVERYWKKPGVLTKVYVNDEELSRERYCEYLMEKLRIPIVHYPQGSPYGYRTWPSLGWRSLYRHVYRRQEFWSDLADLQPPVEQHACVLQFLGLAQSLFSEEYGALVEKEKKVAELQTEREQFLRLLQEISSDLIDEKELGVALTPDSINAAITRLQLEMKSVEDHRTELLSTLLNDATKTGTEPKADRDFVQQLGKELADSQDLQEQLQAAQNNTASRISDVEAQSMLVSNELSRLRRLREAGTVFSELRITHCPACDRELRNHYPSEGFCYLCQRTLEENDEETFNSVKRLDFELEQLTGEMQETGELLSKLRQAQARLVRDAEANTQRIHAAQQMLRPIRTVAASILPPEIAASEIKIGRLQERIQQLERVRTALERRSRLSMQISEIQQQISTLQHDVDALHRSIDFGSAASDLADGMNSYLNAIKEINPQSWTQDPVHVSLDNRYLKMKVGRGSWNTKLGGTLSLYFLISYHYSLMNLCRREQTNYPGFCILDFPAELEDGSAVADKENFVLEPFVGLLSQPELSSMQVIAAGSSFENLAGAHRIELKQIWK